MIDDLKTDELNHCESVEPECQPEDSKPIEPRARQSQENRSDESERSGPDGERLVVSAQLRQKLIEHSLRGPRRPLASLAAAETELDVQSKGLATLRSDGRRQPDDPLVVRQLQRATSTEGVAATLRPQLRRAAIAQYRALDAEDQIDSTLNLLIVGLSNAAMDCLGRAAQAYHGKSADIDYRHAVKTANAVANLIQIRDGRRVPTQINVENVNVEAGGQAIVGHVETKKRYGKKHRSDSPMSKKPKMKKAND